MLQLVPENSRVAGAHRRGVWQSLAVLLAGLLITALLGRSTKSTVDAAARLDFEFNCGEIQGKILERLKDCEVLLRAGAAFYERTGHVSRVEWWRFIELQHIERQFPGTQGVGFALLIPRPHLAQHLRDMRAEGFPAYQVRPEGERDFYTSIILLEPFSNRNLRAFGYDMLSEPVRRAAMERARDQNTPALSGKVTLVQETDQDVQAGTLMFVPVFRRELPITTVADRRAALLGWVYSPYRMGDLMRGIIEGRNLADDQRIRLEVFDGDAASPETLLFDSSAGVGSPRTAAMPWRLQRQTFSAGRPWMLRFTRVGEPVSSSLGSRVWLVWFGGTSTSLLLSGLLFSLYNTRFEARQMAGRLTADLRASEEKFRAIADYTVGWETWFGLDGRILWVSPGVERITGYSPAEVLATPDFIATKIAVESGEPLRALSQGIAPGAPGGELEFPCVHKNGSRFWLSISWQPIFERNGKVLGLRASGRDITALKRAEANLQRANWVVEQSNTSILITDCAGNIEYVNAEFTKVTGYTKEEVWGRNPRLLQSGLTSQTTYEAMWRTLLAGSSWHGEFQNRKKNGEYYWETVAISPLRDLAGHLSHYVAIKQDVTEHRQLQVALKTSNDRLFLAVQAGGVGIWDYHVADNQLVWDDQMFRLYGFTREQFGGGYPAWLQGVHPDDRRRGDDEIQRALRGEKDFNTEFRVVWPDGSLRDIRALALVQRDPAGRPLRMIGTNWDITAEKLAAATLRWNQELLQLMASSSPLGFLVVDNRTDAILHFNRRFCQIWGIEHLASRLDRGELTHRDVIPHYLPMLVDGPGFAASFVSLQDEANRVVVEDELACTQHRTVRRYSTQIRDAADRCHGRFYIFEDISARKRHEEETEALLAREREISEMKSRFIATTSHEFRTPMAAAMVAGELLANHFDRFAPAKRLELLARVNSSLRRMTDMLDEILLLNRLEQNRIEVKLAIIDLRLFLHDLIEEVRLGDRDAHCFEFDAAGDAPRLLTDASLFHHIFSNVLSNAVRYSPAGAPITVRLAADPNRVQVAIEDRGIGIPAADRTRIFEPFERGSNVGVIGGTGLGLNIVKRMTERLGGTIAFDSVAGGGTRFTLVFTREAEPAAAEILSALLHHENSHH